MLTASLPLTMIAVRGDFSVGLDGLVTSWGSWKPQVSHPQLMSMQDQHLQLPTNYGPAPELPYRHANPQQPSTRSWPLPMLPEQQQQQGPSSQPPSQKLLLYAYSADVDPWDATGVKQPSLNSLDRSQPPSCPGNRAPSLPVANVPHHTRVLGENQTLDSIWEHIQTAPNTSSVPQPFAPCSKQSPFAVRGLQPQMLQLQMQVQQMQQHHQQQMQVQMEMQHMRMQHQPKLEDEQM